MSQTLRKPLPDAERNPGCQHCSYYLSPGIARVGGGACIRNARLVKRTVEGELIYRWVECEKPDIKNYRFYCSDFKLRGIVLTIFKTIMDNAKKAMSGEKQYETCAFINEKWWNVPPQ